MRLPELLLEVYGAVVRVCCQQQALLEEIRRDFSYFVCENTARDADFTVIGHLEEKRPQRPSLHHLLIKTKYLSCYDTGEIKYVFYGCNDYVECDYGKSTANAYAADLSHLYELVYALLRSRIGELVERKGLCRVHALAFAVEEAGALFLAPTRGGKSTLALTLLREHPIMLLAEDAPFLDARLNMHPFPLRVGIRPDGFQPLSAEERACARVVHNRKYGKKLLIDVDCFRAKLLHEPRQLCHVLIGRLPKNGQDGCIISRCSRFRLFSALLMNLVIGVGVSQVKEYYLRRSLVDVYGKIHILARRINLAAHILFRQTPYLVRLSSDSGANARILMQFLASQSPNVAQH